MTTESITISLETYEKLMSTIASMRLENQKMRCALVMCEARARQYSKNTRAKYDAYFSDRDSVNLDKHAYEIISKRVV